MKGAGEPVLPPGLGSAGVWNRALALALSASLGGRVLKARGYNLERRKQKIWGRADREAGKQQEPVSTLGFWMTGLPALLQGQTAPLPRLCGRSEGGLTRGQGAHGRTPPGF